jgi:hypothetical protein
LSFASLVHTSLGASGDALEAKLGTTRVPVNPKHARGTVSYSAIGALFATARIVSSVLRARVTGSWKLSPFFRPGSAEPVVAPRVVGADEWVRAARAIDAEHRRAASIEGEAQAPTASARGRLRTHSVFWGSLAYTLIGGTIGATVLTLGFLPALYAAWFRIKRSTALSLQRSGFANNLVAFSLLLKGRTPF